MKTSWTSDQLKAINTDNSNILVSAGAGSGKTAVLSARVLRKLKMGININQLLILTFTKAAAYEMKERIRNAISKDPSLQEQLLIIDSAYITTFDSYALSLVRKYHYLLNIKKDISIMDENIIYIETLNYLEEIFNEMYESKDEKFLKLISDLCVKDDFDIKDVVISINNKLDLAIDKDEFLNNYINNYFNEVKIDSYVKEFIKLIKSKISALKSIYDNLLDLSEDSLRNYLLEIVEKIFNDFGYSDLKEVITSISLPRTTKGASDELKKSKDLFKKELEKISNLFIYEDEEEIRDQILSTKDYVEVIIELVKKLDAKISVLKQSQDLYTFMDIAKMAIKIVRDNPKVKEEVKNSFHEIMIDEYQDTSDIQETFINFIADNNVYTVGDIKQSIYRFRNANPYLFKNKYDQYGKNINGIKVDLTKNFRSRKEVIENINLIFEDIMDEELGGAKYKQDHGMVFGNLSYEDCKSETNYNFEFYNYRNFDFELFNKEEYEAFIIANDIKKKVENKFQVYDKNALRDAKFSDFVILMDRSSKFELYKKIFEFCKIPLTIEADETLNNEYDFKILKNIMKLIVKIKKKENDKEFRYLFTSIARSYLFELKDEEIFEYFINKNFKDSIIYEKCNQISLNLDNLSNQEFLNEIIFKFEIYDKMPLIGSVESIMVRLNYLYEMAENLSKASFDVYKYVNYIENILNHELNIKYSLNKTSNDSVKIMTIHKSKGLEFNICYFSGLYSKYNLSEIKSRFSFDNDYGIIAPFYNEGIRDTILKDLLKEKINKEEISEKIRLFYVALTRCKEKIIFVGDIEELNEQVRLDEYSKRLDQKSFLELISSLGEKIILNIKNLEFNDYLISSDYKFSSNKNISNQIKKVTPVNVKELNIEKVTTKHNTYSKKKFGLISLQESKLMEYGTKIHNILELIDFNNPLLDELIIDDFIKEKVIGFLNSDLMKSRNLAKIFKEYEFSFNNTNGIIDLLLEYNDRIDIIDYKLKNIDDKAYDEQLKGYKNYINQKTNKPINIYLYSLLDERYRQVK